MNNVYMIDTNYGTIVVSKKEYLYTKERITNEECPQDTIIVDGCCKQRSFWKEEVDVNEASQETTTIGYKMIMKYGTIEKPFVPSEFEQSLIDNKDDYRTILELVQKFLRNHGSKL